VYEAEVAGRVSRRDLGRWRGGVVLDDGPARPLDVRLLASGEEWSRLRLTFAEGRKHEVKRYCEALGHPVRRLRRVAFGPLRLGDLPPGAARELDADEVRRLRAAVARDPAPSARRSLAPASKRGV
jgi:pseudouridine synthase